MTAEQWAEVLFTQSCESESATYANEYVNKKALIADVIRRAVAEEREAFVEMVEHMTIDDRLNERRRVVAAVRARPS